MSTVIALLMAALLVFLAVVIGVVIWRSITTKRFPIPIILFLILPVGQGFMLYSFRFTTWSVYWLIGVLMGLLADILLLIFAISQERKTTAEDELKELQHRMNLEKSYYMTVQSRREQLAEIRRTFSKQLETVAGFTGGDTDGRAREMITDLANKIKGTQENFYCAIPVVNAILTEKEKSCVASSIGLSVDLDIPNAFTVSPIHLCSIFSNILDNAIAACQRLHDAAPPVIRLSTLIDGDYLFIKATNPSDKPSQKPAPGRGYGMRILSELAKRYGGDFQSNYRDGVFTAVVSLLAVGSAAEV